MKRTIYALGMMLAVTLSLTNCSKEIDAPASNQEVVKDGVPFELFANAAETKTAITGWATRWVNDDKVNVFHAVAGSTTYYDDGQFSVDATDLTVGRFTGTIAPENLPVSGKYDWYVIYPYSSYIKSPENTGSNPGRVTIGKASNQAQVQTGNDATNHLSGSAFPLYGVATDVDFDASPSITLNNIVSVIEVKVTNKNDDPLTVNSVSFTAPEGTSIVGNFVVNYKANPMTFTDYSTQTSNTADLTVNSGEALNKNEYASFYIGIKPFTATAGQTLKLTVNDYEKSITLSSNVTFASGKIKTLSFDYDKPDEVYELVTSLGAFSDGGKYLFAFQDGVNANKYYFIQNGGSSDNIDADLSVDANTTVTNPDDKYVFTAETSSTLFKFKNTKKKYLYNNGSNTTLNTDNNTGSSWSVSTISGGYFQLNVGSNTGRYISYGTSSSDAKAYANASFKNQHDGSGHALAQYDGALTVFKLGGYTPVAGVGNAVVNGISARGAANLSVNVELANYSSAPSLTATPDGMVVTSASVTSTSATSATITYSVNPNYTGAAAVGTITVADTDSHEGTITINQVADEFSTTATDPFVLGNTSSASRSCTIKSDFDWTINTEHLTGATVNTTSFTYTTSQSQSITFTTTGANTTASPVSLGYIVVTRTADNSTLTINLQQAATATGEALPFNWDGGKNDKTANMTINAGSDYSSSPKVKLDGEGKHVTIRIASAASHVSFVAKQNGNGSGSVVTLKGSADGESFSAIESFTVQPGSSKTMSCASTQSIDSSYRYIKIELTNKVSGVNIGIGTIHID